MKWPLWMPVVAVIGGNGPWMNAGAMPCATPTISPKTIVSTFRPTHDLSKHKAKLVTALPTAGAKMEVVPSELLKKF